MATTSAIRTSSVELTNQAFKLPAYLAEPTETGIFPAVIVLQEIFGVNAHIRDVTERFAKIGYVAIAPALYHRQAPGFEVGYAQADFELGRQYKNGTTATELLSDIQSAIDYVKQLPHVKPNGVGCIGFCFGGHVAYLAATLPDVKATAVFYGAGITSMTPGGGNPTITHTHEIGGTLYGFFGTADPLIPNPDVDQIEAELRKCQVPHQIFRYSGADHGFFCDWRSSYDPTAAADSWEKVQGLFQENL
ncbi:MAG: dienelactone hydrolase family protein [Leptolyngbyaceae cyanobacterium MO_188.B28]|nr:dienelactone hydrolase family protein [Leptolyngbyaceae cyanobacterium MO_188.B28]